MPYAKGKRKGTKSGGGPKRCPKCGRAKKSCGCKY